MLCSVGGTSWYFSREIGLVNYMSRSSQQARQKAQRTLKHAATTWKLMLRSVLNAFADWRNSQLTNFTKSPPLVSMIINAKQEIWRQLENYQRHAPLRTQRKTRRGTHGDNTVKERIKCARKFHRPHQVTQERIRPKAEGDFSLKPDFCTTCAKSRRRCKVAPTSDGQGAEFRRGSSQERLPGIRQESPAYPRMSL